MTTTIEITVRRRIEVPDDKLVLNDYWLKHGGKRVVDTSKTAEPFVGKDEELADAYVFADMVLAPDPQDQADYEQSVKDFEEAKRVRDAKLLGGVLPDELDSDEALADTYLEDVPEAVPACGNCGSTTFRYDEDVYSTNSMVEGSAETYDDGNVSFKFWGGSSYSEGTGYPGVRCDSCDAVLSMPDNIDYEWSS